MTRIVSVSSKLGILIAGDSLGTFHGSPIDFAQSKVFPFLRRFGIGVYGTGEVDGNGSVYSFLRAYEDLLDENQSGEMSLQDVAKAIGNRLLTQRWRSLIGQKEFITDDEFNEFYGGMFQAVHVVGYQDGQPTICRVTIRIKAQMFGKDETFDKDGFCYFPSTDREFFELFAPPAVVVNQDNAIASPLFQDIPDMRTYAISLIKNAAETDSTVGGNINVGLITLTSGFSWLESEPS